MKIKEEIERDCCQSKDLIKYKGHASLETHQNIDKLGLAFCQHCGQVWYWSREMGPAGSMEDVRKKAWVKL